MAPLSKVITIRFQLIIKDAAKTFIKFPQLQISQTKLWTRHTPEAETGSLPKFKKDSTNSVELETSKRIDNANCNMTNCLWRMFLNLLKR